MKGETTSTQPCSGHGSAQLTRTNAIAAEAAESSRDDILVLLAGQRLKRVPVFSGLISVTQPGLDSLGLRFSDVHHDATKMAQAALSTYRLFGFESAVVPLDMCVEAEALGSTVDFRQDEGIAMFPIVEQFAASTISELNLPSAGEVCQRGRIPVVLEAIRQLKRDAGDEIAIGAWIPGPMTLALHVVDTMSILTAAIKDSEAVDSRLAGLAEILIEVALAYRRAGADFITIHEMGGSPGYIGPRMFERLVLPHLQRLLAALPRPRILNVCGRTNGTMALIAQAGAEAIGVDQLNDLALSRQVLGADTLLVGNIDPVATLAEGQVKDIKRAVDEAIAAGVDAIWPGCDLWPAVPSDNMQALVAAANGRQ